MFSVIKLIIIADTYNFSVSKTIIYENITVYVFCIMYYAWSHFTLLAYSCGLDISLLIYWYVSILQSEILRVLLSTKNYYNIIIT